MRSRSSIVVALLILVATSSHSSSIDSNAPKRSPGESPVTKGFTLQTSTSSWTPLPLPSDCIKLIPMLNKDLASTTPISRARSAFLLGQIHSHSSIKLLRAHLRDPDRSVRVQSGIALACMKDSRGFAQCSAALNDEQIWIRYYAVYGLWCMNTAKSKACLRQTSDGGSDLLKAALQEARNSPYFASSKSKQSSTPTTSFKPSTIWIDTASFYNQEADWWFDEGNYEQAIRCEEVSLLFDSDTETFSNIAYLQWSLGHDTEAIATLNRAIKADPEDPDAYYYLGQHYFKTKRYSEAEQPLKMAVDLDGDSLNRRTYAHCLERLGKNEEALKQWEILVNSGTDNGSAKTNMERVQKMVKH